MTFSLPNTRPMVGCRPASCRQHFFSFASPFVLFSHPDLVLFDRFMTLDHGPWTIDLDMDHHTRRTSSTVREHEEAKHVTWGRHASTAVPRRVMYGQGSASIWMKLWMLM